MAPPRPSRAYQINRAIRVLTLLAFGAACGLAIHRFRRTPEQTELTQYVQVQLPSLFSVEEPIDERIERLSRAPGLKPDEARTLLVDDVIPRLLKLRKQAEGLPLHTDEARRLNQEYLGAVDELIDACRACVRVIDDAKLPDATGWVIVRERFADVRRAFAAWDDHVRQACVRHRLAPPTALPRP
jgi:hypothetical protein